MKVLIYASSYSWWQITLIIVLALVVLFVLICLMGLFFFTYFTYTLKKRSQAITVVIKTKYDYIKELMEVIEKAGVAIPEDIKEKFSTISIPSYLEPDGDISKTIRETLSIVKNDLVNLINSDNRLLKHELIKGLLSSIDDVDASYRAHVTNYNSDAVGYNYWVRFIPTRIFYKWAKVKEKNMIS
ncbi:MAG: hypothetical protein LUD22_02255 [Coprobacillus sp.]|nr:hypothetical protein [Coprobacillus sp.]